MPRAGGERESELRRPARERDTEVRRARREREYERHRPDPPVRHAGADAGARAAEKRRPPEEHTPASVEGCTPAEGHEPSSAHRGRAAALNARKAAGYAALHVREFTGHDPEGVISLERREGGWLIGIEVVESHRIPDSTDILAEYRVEVDGDGELVSYHRERRYYRGGSN